MSRILKKYPKATAYMLGAFDASVSNMDVLLENKRVKELVEELEHLIGSKHSKWTRDEIYCRGLDLKEAADDAFKYFQGDETRRTTLYPVPVQLLDSSFSRITLSSSGSTLPTAEKTTFPSSPMA